MEHENAQAQEMTEQDATERHTIWTVGHSTRTLDELFALLASQHIELLADIRTYPGSRRLPHFNQDVLHAECHDRGLRYQHMPLLGGRKPRQPNVDPALNAAWHNPSFHNFADYMQSGPFVLGLDALALSACTGRTAIMCSEALPWKCHRGLVADALVAHGFAVLHILNKTDCKGHTLREGAVVTHGFVAYPAREATALPLFA